MLQYDPSIIRDVKRKRASSYDRTGGNCDHWRLHPGEEKVLLDTKESGCIRHIWFTFGSKDPLHLRNIVLRAYWDGEKDPSVLCPVGDFFGLGHCVYTEYETPWLAASAKGGKALNCFFPMPFKEGARITIENQGPAGIPAYLYFYIDYETGALPPSDAGRFHAHWGRECLTVPDNDLVNLTGNGNFLLADITGRGQYVGTILNVDSPSPVWYGEGDDMFFIDGETWPPSCHGTGTEDYFNTAWCPNKKSIGQDQGVILANHPSGKQFLGKHTLYRFHTKDPVTFKKSLKVSIEHGTGNEFVGDWSATSFWYSLSRKKPLTALPAPKYRKPLPSIPKKAGDIIEQPHKSLSYFFQTGNSKTGVSLINELKAAWEGGKLDVRTAEKWAAKLEKERSEARKKYLTAEKKNLVLPLLSNGGSDLKKQGVKVLLDRVHGSEAKAPLSGFVLLGYDRKNFYAAGEFSVNEKAREGFDYDKIDIMLAPEKEKEDFILLAVAPTFKTVEVLKHRAKKGSSWDGAEPVANLQIPVKIKTSGKTWGFEYAVSWQDLGFTAGSGDIFNLNIDRWNMHPMVWWASWAKTPHHYYPPQLGGRAKLE